LTTEFSSYKRTVFPNGLKVVTEAIPYVRSVSLGLWVDVGSRDESERNAGVSHFIEHMVFKGTQNRNAAEIASCLESVGGVLNAYTSREQTCYFAKILDQHLPLAIEVIFDLAQNGLFVKSEIEKERRVILEEIKDVEDSPSDLVHDRFAQAFFGNHPLGRSILGDKATVRGMGRVSILRHQKKYYRQDRMLVVASGNLNHANLVELVERAIDSGEHDGSNINREKPAFEPVRKLVKRKSTQVHICLGVPSCDFNDHSRSAMYILNSMLGGGMSSRLFQKLRDQLGIVYNVYTYLDYFQDTSIQGIYLATDKKNVHRAIEAVMQEIDRIASGPLPESDLKRVKEQLKGHLMLGLENTSNRMNRLAKHELLIGRYIPLDETVLGIDAVKAEEITELAREIFPRERFAALAMGQVDGDVFAALG
jgi:predicted Zn-dependent peptidase